MYFDFSFSTPAKKGGAWGQDDDNWGGTVAAPQPQAQAPKDLALGRIYSEK